MNQEKLWLDFSSLPPPAQKLVLEFIAFMQRCYNQLQSETSSDTPAPELTEETFVGMWRDRDDLENSSAWVRQVRQNEWGMGSE